MLLGLLPGILPFLIFNLGTPPPPPHPPTLSGAFSPKLSLVHSPPKLFGAFSPHPTPNSLWCILSPNSLWCILPQNSLLFGAFSPKLSLVDSPPKLSLLHPPPPPHTHTPNSLVQCPPKTTKTTTTLSLVHSPPKLSLVHSPPTPRKKEQEKKSSDTTFAVHRAFN